MDVKKSPQADITKRSYTYFLIGLNVILLVILFSLEFTGTYVPPAEKEKEDEKVEEIPEEAIIVERQFDEPPPPEIEVSPPEIPVEIEMVDNDVEIEVQPEIKNQNDEPERQQFSQSDNKNTGDKKKLDLGDKTEKKKEVKKEAEKKVTRATAFRGPVYPGCEKYESNKRELYNCFNDKITSDLQGYLDRDFELKKGEVRNLLLKFEIDTNGNLKFIAIDSRGAEKEFTENTKQAFRGLASWLEKRGRNGKGIEASLNSDKEHAAMDYVIPVKFTGSN